MENKIKTRIKKIKNNVKSEINNRFSLNLPTMLNLSRILLGFIVVYMLFSGYNEWWVGIVFGIAALTDWFDGYFARKYKLVSDLGARLDQISDRIFTVVVVVALLIYFLFHNIQNVLFIFMVCSREIIGAPAFIIRLARHKDTYAVKYIGKLTTFVQSFAIAFIIVDMPFKTIIVFAACILGILAGFDYLRDSFS